MPVASKGGAAGSFAPSPSSNSGGGLTPMYKIGIFGLIAVGIALCIYGIVMSMKNKDKPIADEDVKIWRWKLFGYMLIAVGLVLIVGPAVLAMLKHRYGR